MKKKYGIVSSYNVLCGNATYSEALAKGLEDNFSVLRINVPNNLQKNYDKSSLDKIISEVRQCDYINIQMELSLYGPTPAKAYKVLKIIMKNASSFSITLHRVEGKGNNLLRLAYNHLKNSSAKGLYGLILRNQVQNILNKYYLAIINTAVKFAGKIIVHTYRDAESVYKINPGANVSVFPILWPNYDMPKVDLNKYFDNKFPIVGLFGFVSEYKNYEVVAEGLIDENLNILIAGGVHPESPMYGKISKDENPSYIRKISKLFSSKEYKGRVFIETSPEDSRLIACMRSVDLVCIPYSETGQSGSGIASLAVQNANLVVFSDTHCTHELTNFLTYPPVKFDVDSPLGLRSAVINALGSKKSSKFNGYDFKKLIDVYSNHFSN